MQQFVQSNWENDAPKGRSCHPESYGKPPFLVEVLAYCGHGWSHRHAEAESTEYTLREDEVPQLRADTGHHHREDIQQGGDSYNLTQAVSITKEKASVGQGNRYRSAISIEQGPTEKSARKQEESLK